VFSGEHEDYFSKTELLLHNLLNLYHINDQKKFFPLWTAALNMYSI